LVELMPERVLGLSLWVDWFMFSFDPGRLDVTLHNLIVWKWNSCPENRQRHILQRNFVEWHYSSTGGPVLGKVIMIVLYSMKLPRLVNCLSFFFLVHVKNVYVWIVDCDRIGWL
jgi:hypothetical protein